MHNEQPQLDENTQAQHAATAVLSEDDAQAAVTPGRVTSLLAKVPQLSLLASAFLVGGPLIPTVSGGIKHG